MKFDSQTRRRRRIAAGDEGATVAPEASELLFEANDVAQLVAEVTGEPVDVTADEETVTFEVGDDSYTVEAEGNEEVLESRRIPAGRRRVAASTQSRRRGKTVRFYPSKANRR